MLVVRHTYICDFCKNHFHVEEQTYAPQYPYQLLYPCNAGYVAGGFHLCYPCFEPIRAVIIEESQKDRPGQPAVRGVVPRGPNPGS